MGDFEAAERRLKSADRTRPPEGEPVIDLVATYTRGLLRFGRGRLEEASGAVRRGERSAVPEQEHSHVDPRVQLIEVQVRLGQTAAAAAALAELSSEERDRAEMRLAAAAVHLGEGDPEHALAVLRPAIERSAPTIHPRTASMDALLFAAAAHDARAISARWRSHWSGHSTSRMRTASSCRSPWHRFAPCWSATHGTRPHMRPCYRRSST